MNRNRMQLGISLATVVAVSFFGCVNLAPPWVGRRDAGSAGGPAEAGPSQVDANPFGASGGSNGSGGSFADGGGVIATGGTGGGIDAGAADVTVGTGGTGGAVAVDVGGVDEPVATGGKTGAGGMPGTGGAATGGSTSTPDASRADTGKDVAQDVATDKSSTADLAPEVAVDTAGLDTGSLRGPIVHYTCDQSSGPTLTDFSGNGHNATLTETYAFAAGKSNNGLTLTASNGVDGGSSPGYATLPAGLLSSASEMTVATWVYLNTNPEWSRIFDFGNDMTTYMFLTGNRNNQIAFAITTAGNGKEQRITSSAALPTGGWKHVAVVIGSTGGQLYLDGAEVKANTGMTLLPSSLGSTANNWIGKSQFAANGDPYLDGMIDDFYIYDRARSAAEILALFNK